MAFGHVIDGEETCAAGGARFDRVDPWLRAAREQVGLDGKADVDRAVAVACRAFEDGSWLRMGFAEPEAIVMQIDSAQLIAQPGFSDPQRNDRQRAEATGVLPANAPGEVHVSGVPVDGTAPLRQAGAPGRMRKVPLHTHGGWLAAGSGRSD